MATSQTFSEARLIPSNFKTGSDRPVHPVGHLQNNPLDAPGSYEQAVVRLDLIDSRSSSVTPTIFRHRLRLETLSEFHEGFVEDRNRRQLSRTVQKYSADRSALSP